MPTYDEGIQAKLDSARSKLEEFRAEVRTVTETQRNKVQVIQIGEKSWSPRLTENFDAPLIKWSILTGEIVLHLRSALDHLVYRLVCENGGEPTTQNKFPIVWDIDEICEELLSSEKGLKYGKKTRKYVDTTLEGVGEREKFRILLSQGFDMHRGEYGAYDISTNPSEFSQLNYLCNVDKHRHLISVQPKPGGLTDDYRARQDGTMKKGELPPGLCNTDFEIDVCFRFEQDDDRPSDLSGWVDDILTDITLAVEHTIDYVSSRSLKPFAYLTNEEKNQLRRMNQQRPR